MATRRKKASLRLPFVTLSFLCPFGPPKLAVRVAVLACTRSNRRFCIPKPFCGELVPVSIRSTFASRGFFRSRDAIRSLMRWLYLHRRLRSRQRGSASFDASGVAPIRLITSKGRYSFLSEQLSSHCCKPSKPFGFDSGRPGQRLSAPSVRERCVTTSVPPPGVGQGTRK